MPPKAPSGKVNVSVQPKCGKLLLPYKYERPSKITFSQTLALLGKIYNSNYFFLNHTQINYHLKDGKNTNPYFKKGTTQIHTTKLCKVTLSKFSLLQRSRQHTRSWRLLFHTIHSTHSILHFIHSPMQKMSVYRQ